MGSNRIESFDVSPKVRETIEWRDAKRKELRESYLKQIHNPVNQKLAMDPGIHRYSYVRSYYHLLQNLNVRFVVISTAALVGTIYGVIHIIKKSKDEEAYKCSTGQIKYADREYKFRN
ncbi:NADH dehydrogenase (ubiquinone) B15 subunit [Augochlora pura]